MVSRFVRLTSVTHHRESQTGRSGKIKQVQHREKKDCQGHWQLGPMLVKAQICVDFAAGSEKSSSTTGQTTMGHVLAQSVAVEGLENEKKKFSYRPRRPKNTCRMVTIDHGRGPSSSRKATFFVVKWWRHGFNGYRGPVINRWWTTQDTLCLSWITQGFKTFRGKYWCHSIEKRWHYIIHWHAGRNC